MSMQPTEVRMQRDAGGQKATSAEFSYEVPSNPDLVLQTDEATIDECVEQVLNLLRSRKIIR